MPSVSGRYYASVGQYRYEQSAAFYQGNSLDLLQPVSLNGVSSTNGLSLADLLAGHEYRIRVTAGSDTVSLRVLKVTSPANDNFADRIRVAGASVGLSGSSEFATTEPGEPPSIFNETLWWSWIAPRTGAVRQFSRSASVDVFTGTSLTNLT